MDDLDPELLRQIMEAGLYSQHLQPLQQRYQLGQQFMDTPAAHGAQVGNTYQAASWTEHLANALRQFAGAKMMKDSRTGQQNLTSQLGNDRAAYAQALQGTGGKTVAGDYGEPLQGVGADPQKMNRLAMLGSLSGDPAMQHAAQMAMQERHAAFQDLQLQNTLRHQQALEALGTGRLGVAQQNSQIGQQRADQGAVKYNPNDSEFQNISPLVRPRRKSVLPLSTNANAPAAGPALAPAAPTDAADTVPGHLGKWQDTALQKLGADFNPSSGRSGEFGKNQGRLNAANRLLALAVDPKTGGPANLTPQQMSEVSSSLATLIGGGGSSEASRHEMTPYTKGRSMAELLQWWTDAPHGAGQQAFVKQMIDTARREQGVAQQGIDQVRGQLVNKHQRILRSNPEESRKVLQPFGWDLGPDGLPVQTQQQAAPISAATGATVDVVSPEGVAGKIPAEKLDAALKRGFKRAGP